MDRQQVSQSLRHEQSPVDHFADILFGFRAVLRARDRRCELYW